MRAGRASSPRGSFSGDLAGRFHCQGQPQESEVCALFMVRMGGLPDSALRGGLCGYNHRGAKDLSPGSGGWNERSQVAVVIGPGRPGVHAQGQRLVDNLLGRHDPGLHGHGVVELRGLRLSLVVVGAGLGALIGLAGSSGRGRTGGSPTSGSGAGYGFGYRPGPRRADNYRGREGLAIGASPWCVSRRRVTTRVTVCVGRCLQLV